METGAESVDQRLHCLHLSPHKTSSTGKIFKKSVGIKNGFPLLKTLVEIVEIVETGCLADMAIDTSILVGPPGENHISCS